MLIVQSYTLAVFLCVITMLCWGSWANTQKLASKDWSFQLFYWDYVIGLVVFTLIFGLTIGSSGSQGQSFMDSLSQASSSSMWSAFLGGVVFNIANLLIVAAIAIAGMATAFPVGIGLALVLGVVVNYLATPVGDAFVLFSGVALVIVAIVLDALAYRSISSGGVSTKGIVIALAGGTLMGFFFRFVAASMTTNFTSPEPGLMTPYAAVFVFSVGVFLSNFLFNSFFMYSPLYGEKVTYREYVRGGLRSHTMGLLGGFIWVLGMTFSLIASEKAGFAISYGLGQGATMVAALWGVFVWKEFKGAPPRTNRLITLMFLSFVAGLVLIIISRNY